MGQENKVPSEDVGLKLSVIIPVYNGGANFRICLDALFASTRLPDQVIVVDDASTDCSLEIARDYAVELVELHSTRRGAAHARNCGVAQAWGEILMFIDADVAVHQDTLAQVDQVFEVHQEVDALFGSYDDHPLATNSVSRFKNLLHHYVHQHAQREASTFWTGCGAIRRSVFSQVGGLNSAWLSIEDIEFGYRIRRAGYRIWLCREIQATHLKKWSLVSWLRTDIFNRAIPWSNLIVEHHELPTTLNLNWNSRVSAISVLGGLFFLLLGILYPPLWLLTSFSGLSLIILNFDLYRFFFVKGGVGFGLVAILLHWVYLSYSIIIFGAIFIRSLTKLLHVLY